MYVLLKSLNRFSLRQLGAVLISSRLTLPHNLNHFSPQQKSKFIIKCKNRLMPSRFGNCQKQIVPHGNSSIQTQLWQEEGLFPAAVSFCFGLAVTLRRIKCCFVAAVSCPSACLLLCILCTVQHVEGEIKVKATSTGSCSRGTLHAKDHTEWIHKHEHSSMQPASQEFLLMQETHTNATQRTCIFAHAGVPFVPSVFHSDGWVGMRSTWRVITWGPVEAFFSPIPTEKWAPQWNKIPSQNGNDGAHVHPPILHTHTLWDKQMQAHLSACTNTVPFSPFRSLSHPHTKRDKQAQINTCARPLCRSQFNYQWNEWCLWFKKKVLYQNSNHRIEGSN